MAYVSVYNLLLLTILGAITFFGGISWGVELNLDPTTLSIPFAKVAAFDDYWSASWCGFDAKTNRIYLLGGDRGPSGLGAYDANGVYYDVATDTYEPSGVTMPQTPVMIAMSQDYTQIGRTMYRIEATQLYSLDFDLFDAGAPITPKQVNLPGVPQSTADTYQVALCSDGNRYLFAVGTVQLYIYDIFNLEAAPIAGPTLNHGSRSFSSCAYSNNAVFVIGGIVFGNSAATSQLKIEKTIVDVDEPANMQFSQVQDIGIRWGHRAWPIGDYIYILGGATAYCAGGGADTCVGTTSVDVFNAVDATFSARVATLAEGIMFSAFAIDSAGKMYLFGGQTTTFAPIGAPLCSKNAQATTSGVTGSCTNPLRSPRRLVWGGNGGASGDPHFTTFTKRRFDFQGKGCYYYLTTCPGSAFLLPFNVRVKHAKCNSVARCIENVYVDIVAADGDGAIIETIDLRDDYLSAGVARTYTSQTDGLDAELQVSRFSSNTRTVTLQSQFAEDAGCGVKDLQLQIKKYSYNGATYFNLNLQRPACYECEACGLIGYVSNDAQNSAYDFVKGDNSGTLAKSANEFGYSWYYGTECPLAANTDPDAVPDDDVLPDAICDLDPAVDVAVTAACEALFAEAEFVACCNGWDECVKEKANCKFDSCAILTDLDDAIAQASEAVEAFSREALTFLCEQPDAPNNLIAQCSNQYRENIGVRRLLVWGGNWGDPHFTTFHGRKYDFQGAGCYYYMTSCPTVDTPLSFNLRASHWKCNSVARCAEDVYVDLFDSNGNKLETLDVTTLNPDTATTASINYADGSAGSYTLSKYSAAGASTVREFRLETDLRPSADCGPDLYFKLTKVPYNGKHYINLYVQDPGCYKCEVCGLYGFYSDTAAHELLMGPPESNLVELAADVTTFGYSWRYGDTCPGDANPVFTTEQPIDVLADCDGRAADVTTACDNLYNVEHVDCCAANPECGAESETTCVFDTCAALMDDASLSVEEAIDVFARPDIEFLCSIPVSVNPIISSIDCDFAARDEMDVVQGRQLMKLQFPDSILRLQLSIRFHEQCPPEERVCNILSIRNDDTDTDLVSLDIASDNSISVELNSNSNFASVAVTNFGSAQSIYLELTADAASFMLNGVEFSTPETNGFSVDPDVHYMSYLSNGVASSVDATVSDFCISNQAASPTPSIPACDPEDCPEVLCNSLSPTRVTGSPTSATRNPTSSPVTRNPTVKPTSPTSDPTSATPSPTAATSAPTAATAAPTQPTHAPTFEMRQFTCDCAYYSMPQLDASAAGDHVSSINAGRNMYMDAHFLVDRVCTDTDVGCPILKLVAYDTKQLIMQVSQIDIPIEAGRSLSECGLADVMHEYRFFALDKWIDGVLRYEDRSIDDSVAIPSDANWHRLLARVQWGDDPAFPAQDAMTLTLLIDGHDEYQPQTFISDIAQFPAERIAAVVQSGAMRDVCIYSDALQVFTQTDANGDLVVEAGKAAPVSPLPVSPSGPASPLPLLLLAVLIALVLVDLGLHLRRGCPRRGDAHKGYFMPVDGQDETSVSDHTDDAAADADAAGFLKA